LTLRNGWFTIMIMSAWFWPDSSRLEQAELVDTYMSN